jgi:hypothetical protein
MKQTVNSVEVVVVNQVPYAVMHNAFSWYQNIGDALHHFSHYGSFLSETHREEAIKILGSIQMIPFEFVKEMHELKYYVDHAPINPNKSKIAKV